MLAWWRAVLVGPMVLVLAMIVGTMSAHAQKKHAFVVGINIYDNLPAHAQLQKAVGDAKALSEALAGLGFTVTAEPNATRTVFNDRWQQFLDGIKPGDTAAVVFSGHGVEIGGANYLLPRDVPRIRLGRDELLKRESLSLAEMLADLREKRPGFSFVVLDACRDNPFAEGGKAVGGAKGLARIEPPEGTFIMFSAGAYQTALDRLSDGDKAPTSIYTRTLLPLLKAPGLSLLDMADRVGEQVRDLAQSVSHKQTPAFYSGVVGGRRVCLAGCEVPPTAASPRPGTEPASSAAEVVRVCREVETMTSLAMLGVLERQNNGTPAGDCISARIGELKAAQTAAARGAPSEGAAQTQAKGDARLASADTPKTAAPKGTAAPKSSADTGDLTPGRVFRDCPNCPEMVIIRAGGFTMGSPAAEERYPGYDGREEPQHKVTLARPIAIGKLEVTVDQYETFVKASGHSLGDGCFHWTGTAWETEKGSSFRKPGFSQSGAHPVTCVNWDDAKAYAAWLAKTTGKPYRLPSEAEWEFAARAGTTGPFSTGAAITTEQANFDGNYTYGGSAQGAFRQGTVEAGGFKPNAFGLYDMHGNASEWVGDCFHKTYSGAPADGSAWTTGACDKATDSEALLRILRGGSWLNFPSVLRSAVRFNVLRADFRVNYAGFRVARGL